MAVVTVRNLSDETHRALRLRAADQGRSTEAEIRAILDEAVLPQSRLKMGSALADLARPMGGLDLDIRRDKTPAIPIAFE